MRTKEKLRMCPFCEGSIDIDATSCRFCGASLVAEERGRGPSAYSTQENLASLYAPPYAPPGRKNIHSPSQQAKKRYAYEEYEEENRQKKQEREKEKKAEEEKSHIGSLLLLSIGAQLFTLSALLFFFSDHGRLTLEWKSRYWFLYMMISLPFLYHGWKKLKQDG